jgi:hypothetical protein
VEETMKRTTILADEAILVEVRDLAERSGTTVTAVVQDALREYLAAHRPRRSLPFVGIANSGDPTWAARDEEILAAAIDPIEGRSPRRQPDQVDGIGRG